MFMPYSEAKAVEMAPGVQRKVLAYDEDMMVVEFTFDAGVKLPLHTHPHKQASCVIQGKLEFTLGDEKFVLSSGDTLTIASDIPHGVEPLEPSVVIDVFSPMRKEFV